MVDILTLNADNTIGIINIESNSYPVNNWTMLSQGIIVIMTTVIVGRL